MYVPVTAKSHKKRPTKSGRARQLCTSRLGSGLHLYPHASHTRRAQGADAPIRAYNLPPRTLSLARPLARSFDREAFATDRDLHAATSPTSPSVRVCCVRAGVADLLPCRCTTSTGVRAKEIHTRARARTCTCTRVRVTTSGR